MYRDKGQSEVHTVNSIPRRLRYHLCSSYLHEVNTPTNSTRGWIRLANPHHPEINKLLPCCVGNTTGVALKKNPPPLFIDCFLPAFIHCLNKYFWRLAPRNIYEEFKVTRGGETPKIECGGWILYNQERKWPQMRR